MGSVVRRSIALALAGLFLTAGVAFAHGGPGPGVKVTHFEAFGNCKGERLVKHGPHGFVEDVERCVMPENANGLKPGTYSIFTPGVDGWFSDYDYLYTKSTDKQCDQPISTEVGFCIREAFEGTIVVKKARHHTVIWTITTFY